MLLVSFLCLVFACSFHRSLTLSALVVIGCASLVWRQSLTSCCSFATCLTRAGVSRICFPAPAQLEWRSLLVSPSRPCHRLQCFGTCLLLCLIARESASQECPQRRLSKKRQICSRGRLTYRYTPVLALFACTNPVEKLPSRPRKGNHLRARICQTWSDFSRSRRPEKGRK